MSDGVVISEECSAKDGWNLGCLGSPLFLLGGHRFLLGSTPRWSECRVFQHQREKSFIDEHRCFLHHFLAKCSLSDRPGLDVRAGFWRKPVSPQKYITVKALSVILCCFWLPGMAFSHV